MKSLTLRVGIHALQRFTRRERKHMSNEIEVTDFLANSIHQRLDLLITRNVTLHQQWIVEQWSQFSDVFAQPLTLIRQYEPSSRLIDRIRDTPRDAALVGDPHDQAGFAFE